MILATEGRPLALIAPVKPFHHLARQETAGVCVLGVCVGEQFQ